MTNQESVVLTRKEAASFLKICLTTLDRIKDLSRIKIRRGVRYLKMDLDKWLKTQAAQGKP
jgi:hypothetical protein